MTSREVTLRHGPVKQTMTQLGWPSWAFGIQSIRSKLSILRQRQVRSGPGQIGGPTICRFESGGDEVIDQVAEQPSARRPRCGHICHLTSPFFSRVVVPGCVGVGWFPTRVALDRWPKHQIVMARQQAPPRLPHRAESSLPGSKEAATATRAVTLQPRGQGRATESCRGGTAGVLARVEWEGPAKGGQTHTTPAVPLENYHPCIADQKWSLETSNVQYGFGSGLYEQ